MIEWLSDWLRSIIAVILLAVFVELLLPGKAMLRYARLVVGLFVLLTIMTPVLKLIQGDFDQQLMNRLGNWNPEAAGEKIKMPSLEDIRENAGKLTDQRTAEAGRLTERVLERQIESAIEHNVKADVSEVDVKLSGEQSENQALEQVVVTLKPGALTGTEAGDPADGLSSGDTAPVAVNVSVEPVEEVDTEAETNGAADKEAGDSDDSIETWAAVPPEIDRMVRELLKETWGIDSGLVAVRQPAVTREKH